MISLGGATLICTFFGHKDTSYAIYHQLKASIDDLIVSRGIKSFLVGNQGCFDGMVHQALKELREIHPEISYSIVLAYMPGKRQNYMLLDSTETLLPEGIDTVPRRYAISWRNKWMVRESQIVVCYIDHPWGGAAQFAKYAESQGKEVINLAKQKANEAG